MFPLLEHDVQSLSELCLHIDYRGLTQSVTSPKATCSVDAGGF
jgi:hypothetical protein